jgi:solute carrier family 25 protein 16
MTYDYAESILIPTPSHRTPTRYFVAGALSGVTSVLCTYPLELIRVRLAYQTTGKINLREAISTIYHEADVAASKSNISAFTRNLPLYPFYRGFSISIIGMIPYAGVSFLTYGTLKRHIEGYIPYLAGKKTQKDLACGAVAGVLSQSASYPFEVIRRRMQVGGVGGGGGVSWRDAVKAIYTTKGWRGFFVGLSIGYIKVVPMTRWALTVFDKGNPLTSLSISFATWQFMKGVLEI